MVELDESRGLNVGLVLVDNNAVEREDARSIGREHDIAGSERLHEGERSTRGLSVLNRVALAVGLGRADVPSLVLQVAVSMARAVSVSELARISAVSLAFAVARLLAGVRLASCVEVTLSVQQPRADNTRLAWRTRDGLVAPAAAPAVDCAAVRIDPMDIRSFVLAAAAQ